MKNEAGVGRERRYLIENNHGGVRNSHTWKRGGWRSMIASAR